MKKARKRPYARGGKIHNPQGTAAIFLIVMSLAFLRWHMPQALVGSLAVLAVLLIFMARRWEARRTLDCIDKMSGHDFERYLVDVFQACGYKTTLVGEDGADYGADLIVCKKGKRFAVQAKNYAPDICKVGNDAVQQAIAGASYYDCDEAIVVTNSRFTRAAGRQAAYSHRIPVTLISRDNLKKMIKRL